MRHTRMMSTTVAGMALLIAAAASAAAEEHANMPPTRAEGLHGSIGLGIGLRPEYEGAKDREMRLMPNINLRYGDTLFLRGMTAGANLFKQQTAQGLVVTAGPLLALRRGRNAGDNAALTGLGDIDRSLDAGAFVRLRMGGWQAGADVRKDVSNGDGGTTVNLSAGYGRPLAPKLQLRATIDTTWASAAYMNTFYGIDATQSLNSGLARYDAGAGVKSVGAGLMADYGFSRDWGAFASLRYKRLVGDAADSPIVAGLGTESQVTTSVGLKYRF